MLRSCAGVGERPIEARQKYQLIRLTLVGRFAFLEDSLKPSIQHLRSLELPTLKGSEATRASN